MRIHDVSRKIVSRLLGVCIFSLSLCHIAYAATDNSADVKKFEEWLNANAQGAVQTSTPTPPTSGITTEQLPVPANPAPFLRKPVSYVDQQRTMLESIPPSNQLPTPESNAAFNEMMQKNMPLQPEQVIRLHQQVDLSQRAAAVPPNIPPKPVSTTLMINLAPGSTPPAVRLAQGYVTALVFIDSTGTPWPIAAFDIGNPKAVNLQWDGKSNIILIQAVAAYGSGDIVVRLVGLATPLTLQLVAGQPVVDYRVDIHVPGIGPNTKDVPIGTALPANASQLLLGVLDGVAPSGSRILRVKGADAEAWELNGKLYLRTRLTLLSPGWVGKMVSPDGTIAYELSKTSSVLVSRYGEPVELKIEGF